MNKEEQELLELISKVHNTFAAFKQTHPSDITRWVDGIHEIQSVLMNRITRRDYPETFKTITEL